MTTARGDFPGGLRLPTRTPATPWPVAVLPPPAELWIPLPANAESRVSTGDRVRAGQCLWDTETTWEAAVHAPLDGTVLGVEDRAIPGQAWPRPHLGIAVAPNQSEPERLPALRFDTLEAAAFHARLREAGVIGMGGAGFPAAAKAAGPPRWLIINGAECEPFVCADAALMTEQAHEVVEATRWWQRALQAEQVVLVLKTDRPAVLDALQIAQRAYPELQLLVVPDRYPAGGERQVIFAVTGIELAGSALPADIGVRVQNVATVVAGLHAARDGEPLTHRIVTVAGSGTRQPGNVRSPIGAPAHALIAAAGGYADDAAALIAGGPMMGVAAADDGFSIEKTTIALTVLSSADCRSTLPAMPCIRCGDCAPVCPARLAPHQLHASLMAGHTERAVDDGLMDCIECGACDLVCPSHITLTDAFRLGRAAERERRYQRDLAKAAEQRHRERGERLQRLAIEQAEQQAQRQQKAVSAAQAALARARAKKAAGSDEGGVHDPPL